MTPEYTYSGIKGMRRRSRLRKAAIREYLRAQPTLVDRVVARTAVDRSMVSKVLHGHRKSRKVEEAILAEESSMGAVAA